MFWAWLMALPLLSDSMLTLDSDGGDASARLQLKMVHAGMQRDTLQLKEAQQRVLLRELSRERRRVDLAQRQLKAKNASVADIVKEAARGNLKELQSQLKDLKKGLHYAKAYLNDSKQELTNLTAEAAESSLPEELREAKEERRALQKAAAKATAKENRMWKKTLQHEVELSDARQKYRESLEQLEEQEAARPKQSRRLRKGNESAAEAEQVAHSGLRRSRLTVSGDDDRRRAKKRIDSLGC
ncbi:unnamed protein product [Effrenium voratum]|uniref:Uncharacterized protein n=1 Tax=Effrenium voratum TaxID=2562239 RepID=A0AA36IYR1_9DINO|nr:unnamed protein product [Effrenium voratum]CAJ1419890.1 unnamed protein product [Effrenium voratum]